MISRYASLRQGLVGAWCPSLGASGYRLIDRSGYNHGVLTNMDPGTDWVASGGKLALDFDGVNDYVLLRATTYSKALSICAWVKTNASTRRESIFTGQTSSFAPNLYVHIEPVSGSTAAMNFYSGGYYGVSSSFTQDTNWHFYVWTINQNGTISYFRDGSGLGNAATTYTGSDFTAADPSIGAINQLAGSNFTLAGQIDDFRIYNRALTPSEIQLLYTGGRGVGLMPERIKHRRKTTAAAFNRRRRILIGASQ